MTWLSLLLVLAVFVGRLPYQMAIDGRLFRENASI
jgi:hypothetical protein